MAVLRHGNDVYTMLIDIIMDLTPRQAEYLYSDLIGRYTKRGRIKRYNENGDEDKEGKIRLLPNQYQAIRTKLGDNYIHKAFLELTNYIKFLEKNAGSSSKYAQKLQKLNSESHNRLIADEDGWVYRKCKDYILTDRPRLNLNPFLIDDFATAKEYISNIPKEVRDTSLDVQALLLRFPELACDDSILDE